MDYEKIGLKAGLEIHQQLNTNKLFCSCPSIIKQDNPDIIIERKLHLVSGESEKKDVAAEFEAAKKRKFIYQAYSDSTCLVELDEEPPHEINKEALKIALQISKLLNAKPLKHIQVMRKIIINGSNTSGFQRTMLIATDGYVMTSKGKVRIETIGLEEDAAREIKKDESSVTFRLDRLGIPLIEISTAPDIKTPEQAKEVALKIGEILRVGNVKRGIGTIRQDVNLSIKNSERIEIKGVQEPWQIEETIKQEVERQILLVKENKSIAEVRKANQDGSTTYLRPLPGAARMYPETDIPIIDTGPLIKSLVLPKLKDEIKKELIKTKLNKELLTLILKENKVEEFKELLKENQDSNLVAKLLVLLPKEIAAKEKLTLDQVNSKLNMDAFILILENLKKLNITESSIKDILTEIVKGTSVEKAIHKFRIQDINIEEELKKLIKEKPGLSPNAYMGILMKKFRGKIDARKAMELIKENISS